ncbi:MAG: hypothetical protein M3P06_11625 [Acidobacteriota bacterium]|nr:hypothetical protein [Acidobacteriota bacterium]
MASKGETYAGIGADVVRFTVPVPPYALGLNGSRVHWSKRSTVKRDYQEAVWIAGHGLGKPISCPWTFAEVEYDWYSIRQVDLDNIVIRMKYALDVMTEKGLNIIVNDKGVNALTTRWHKAAKPKDERVIVTVTRRDP